MRACSLLLLLALSASAHAHRFAPSLLQLTESGADRVAVTWKTPIQQVSDIPMEPELPDSCAVQEQSPWIREGTGRLRQSIYRCSGGLVGQSIGVSGLGPNQSSVMLNLSLADGIGHQAVLTADDPEFLVPTEPDPWQVVGRYSVLGAEHIWAGLDHLLFVLGLLLLVGGGRRLVFTITAFTVGHSVTLAMVTLGVFDYPVAFIEFLIALSIFVLALELTREQGQSRLWRQPWWLAGGFGLLHGMGFAGALADTGLPQGNLPLALLFFNVGIELGQLAFIAILLLAAALFRRVVQQPSPAWVQLPVFILGALSAMWCIERGLAVLA
ncbi:MAG: HupE/UreJ family protein [Luminiphilus sp.]